MDNGTLTKFSLPMGWLALAAAIEVGLVILAATPVQSEPVAASQLAATASSPIVGYARAVAAAIRWTETAVISIDAPERFGS